MSDRIIATPYDGPVPLDHLVIKDRELFDSLRARIAALEKCIEARDALIAQAYGDLSTDPELCDCLDCKLRIAIRRADEEAGRA